MDKLPIVKSSPDSVARAPKRGVIVNVHTMNRSTRPSMSRTIRRRVFLAGGAGCVIALPLFESLSRAQAPSSPARFIAYVQPFGCLGEYFWPGMPAFDVNSGQIADYPCSGRTALNDPNFQMSPILKPLEAFKQDLVVVEGLENAFGNHDAYCAMLTGMPAINPVTGGDDGDLVGDGISIDHELARHIGKDTRYPSLQLGVFTGDGTGSKGAASWSAARQAAPPQQIPHLVWEKLFADVGGDPAAADQVRQENASVLDFAISQATSIQARLGQTDRERLDQYLTAFRGVEQNIGKLALAGCQKPAEPLTCDKENPTQCEAYFHLDLMPKLVAAQFDLLAMALACDLTRVASFQMSVEGNDLVFPWTGNTGGGWHALSHLGPSQGPANAEWIKQAQEYVKTAIWNTEQLALLAQRLKDFGVYDNTLVLYTQTMGNAQVHHSVNCPNLTLGNVNGALKPGRHVRVGDPIENTRRINDLLVTVLNAFKVPATSFGLPAYNKGPITEMLA